MARPDRIRARAPVSARVRGVLPALVLLLCHPPVLPAADEGRIDDVRMEVVEDPDADERDYVDRIELPAAAAPAARERAGGGRADEAGEEAGERARERGRAVGRETAREARELGDEARRPDERPGAAGDDRPGRRPQGPPEETP